MMVIGIQRNVITVAMVALALPLALPAMAADYVYTAQTQSRAAQQGPVRAGALTWDCRDSQCTIKGPWESPGIGACQALARIVGPIKSYGRKGRTLDVADLAKCNQGLALAPVFKLAPQAPPRQVQTPALKGDVRTTGLVTPAITFRGTGAPLLPERGADLGLEVTTSAITFEGTGALPSRTAIEPLTVTTPEITFRGAGAIE